MFTGIIQQTGTVKQFEKSENLANLIIEVTRNFARNLQLGASVAVNGVCLSLTQKESQQEISRLHFDVIHTTLALTNLFTLTAGTQVNLERSFTVGDEIGGHFISGHVSNVVVISEIIRNGHQVDYWFETPTQYMKYLIDKGFVGLDGMSLTIAEVAGTKFKVSLIPDTLKKTTIGQKKLGDLINLEIDHYTRVMIDNLEKMLPNLLKKYE